MKYDAEKIGKTIFSERTKLGLTQKELGKRMNIVGKQISNYEKGKTIPPIDVMMKLCDIFNCELGYLLGEPDYSEGTRIITYLTERTGLTADAINNIYKLTGTEKHCVSFGVDSESYRAVLNSFLTSPHFIQLIRGLRNLAYQVESRELSRHKVEQTLGKELYDEAYEIYKNSNPYQVDERVEDLRPELKEALRISDTAEYEPDEYVVYIKIARYELNETFERLVESIYPTAGLM